MQSVYSYYNRLKQATSLRMLPSPHSSTINKLSVHRSTIVSTRCILLVKKQVRTTQNPTLSITMLSELIPHCLALTSVKAHI